MPDLLHVENLRTYYAVSKGDVKAVDDVSFTLQRGRSLGIAGESGCGKSTLGYSLINLVPAPGRIVSGKIYVDGADVTSMVEAELRRKVRWEKISMVFQGAMNSLNPVYSVERQMVETVRMHRPDMKKEAGRSLALKTLELVGLTPDILRRYPHELSGGMKQRVVIATALMLNPDIVIADEPTTALDVVVQAQIINLIKELQQRLNMTIILITHDLSIIPEISDDIAIMYAGKLVEYGRLDEIYRNPRHPYTHALLRSIPRLKGDYQLTYIPGAAPDLVEPPAGCRFHPRCPYAVSRCKSEVPRLEQIHEGHYAACHRAHEALW